MTNNEKLRALLADGNIPRRLIADILGVPVRRVDSWMADPGTSYYRGMTDEYWDKLVREEHRSG